MILYFLSLLAVEDVVLNVLPAVEDVVLDVLEIFVASKISMHLHLHHLVSFVINRIRLF